MAYLRMKLRNKFVVMIIGAVIGVAAGLMAVRESYQAAACDQLADSEAQSFDRPVVTPEIHQLRAKALRCRGRAFVFGCFGAVAGLLAAGAFLFDVLLLNRPDA